MVDGDSGQVLSYPMRGEGPLDPPAEWADLRRRCPAATVRLPSGDEATLVTRHADVKQVLSDPRFTRPLPGGGGARVADSESGGVFNTEMAATIPQFGDEHQRWRQRIGRWFTAKRMATLRPRIERKADELIDAMVADGAPADLKSALAFPLPVWVICDMLGVPDSDRGRFSHWSDTLLSMTRYTQAEIDAAQAEFVEYMLAHVRAMRADPGDDLLSELAADTETTFSDGELVATGQSLLVAGHETTANMIGKMVAMLLADRTRWERLCAEPALVRTTVEEALRFDANSGFGMLRHLDDDLEIADTVLPEGTTVVCSMASANRDEDFFTDADDMTLDRSPNPHLAFGAGGHSCLGQALARTELQTTLEVLLRRLPTLEPAVPVDELRRLDGLVVGGLEEVPVRW
ncbi:cytochrome P450 [Saccharomonospora iraqiensis]|uniref:cytochrome P450 n=1 Tax=Saccharomonospora iraqiensis TaxID=52698 RepID=UPI0003F74A3E|nr:cytochrome P450 [Saccharomonospora iraqiensis]